MESTEFSVLSVAECAVVAHMQLACTVLVCIELSSSAELVARQPHAGVGHVLLCMLVCEQSAAV